MENKSIYHHVGGHEKIGPMVDDFYKSVMADPTVSHFFQGIDMEKQREHQTNFLSFAMGGPNSYTGRAMEQAHANLNTSHEHFDAILGHFQQAMKKHEMEDHHIQHMVNHISSYRGHIVSE